MIKITNKTARVISLPAVNAGSIKTAADRKFIDAKEVEALAKQPFDLVALAPLEFVTVSELQAKFMIEAHKPMELLIDAGYLEIEEVDKAA